MAYLFSFLSLLLLVATPCRCEAGEGSPPVPETGGPFPLIAVTPSFDLGTGGHVGAADYHLAGDGVDHLAIGDRLLVERERHLGPPVSEAVATLYIPVATVRIIHVGADSAVARLDTPLPRDRHPHLTYPGPMVGDRLVPARAAVEEIVLPSQVLFDFDRAEIRPDARPVLDEIATRLMPRRVGTIEVHGHTDALGTEAYNQALSRRRAQSVADYLAAVADIPRGRFAILGHGEGQPVAGNGSPAGRQRNRRVVVRLPATSPSWALEGPG